MAGPPSHFYSSQPLGQDCTCYNIFTSTSVCFFNSMRYTALSTTSSTSFCGQHVQLRCFCIGLANCYVAGTEPHRRSAGGFRTAFPAQDCNVAARAVLGGLHHEYRWERIAA